MLEGSEPDECKVLYRSEGQVTCCKWKLLLPQKIVRLNRKDIRVYTSIYFSDLVSGWLYCTAVRWLRNGYAFTVRLVVSVSRTGVLLLPSHFF